MKRNRRAGFNMVEVVLALAVAALGITAIIGIMPVALNASRDTAADTSVADIVPTILYNIDFDFRNDWANAIADTTKYPATPAALEKAADLKMPAQDDEGNAVAASETRVIKAISGKNGYQRVWFRREGAAYADFIADVRVWKVGDTASTEDIQVEYDGTDLAVPVVYTADDNSKTLDLIRIYVEVSFPAGAAEAKRTKRVFVREYVRPDRLKEALGE